MIRILDVVTKIKNIDCVVIYDKGCIIYSYPGQLTDDQLLKEFTWFEVTFHTGEPRLEFHTDNV